LSSVPAGPLEVAARPWVLLGPGTSREVADVTRSVGARRVLLLTTGNWRDETLESVTRSLGRSRVAVTPWSHPLSNITDREVARALRAFDEGGCDALVPLGGGSAHDTAKAVRVLLANVNTPINEYRGRNPERLPSAIPHIAVNTTSGTGAEVSNSYVYTDTRVAASPRKRFVIDRLVVPTAAINDPLLMRSQPAWLVRFAGIDALTHAIEAFSARPAHLLVQHHAACAARLILENLERAVDNPNDLSAMKAMCVAQYLAGLAFSAAGLGLVHAVSHALSAHFDLHHGVANGIALPFVLNYNIGSATSSYAELAVAAGLDTGVGSEATRAARFVEEIVSLLQKLAVPATAAEARGGPATSPSVRKDLLAHVMEDPCIATNPRTVRADVELADLIAGVAG